MSAKGKGKGKRAFSYIRFSSKRQAAGDSVRRQLEWGVQVCEREGWTLDDGLRLQDFGVSAFRGKNAAMGALARFRDAIERGQVHAGDVLLVESLDRLSRATIQEALELLLSILRTSVEVCTRTPERVYTRKSTAFEIMEALVYMERANNESQTKSMRGKSAWKASREEFTKSGKPCHKVAPGWLRLNKDKSKFEVIPSAAKAVQLIYKLAGEGLGIETITARLNKDEVPAIGKTSTWNRSYVAKLLSDQAVCGIYQPHIIDPETGRRIPHGEPIRDYFPQVVGEEEWYRVRSAVRERGQPRARGRSGPGVTSLFSGLVRDARDGHVMHTSFAGSSRKPGSKIMISWGARNGEQGSEWRPVPYRLIEESVLQTLKEVSPRDLVPGPRKDTPADLLNGAQAKLEDLGRKKAKVQQRVLNEEDTDALLDLLAKLHEEERSTRARIESLKLDAAQDPLDGALSETQSLIDLFNNRKGEELLELRIKLKAKIRSLVESIWVLSYDLNDLERGVDVQLYFKSGLLRHQTLAWKRRGSGRGTWTGISCDMKEGMFFADLRKYRSDAKTRQAVDEWIAMRRAATVEDVDLLAEEGGKTKP